MLELVWADASVEEGNLAQQVLLLRRALADAGEAVATVPRHGYRFVAPVVEENDANRDLFVSPHCLIWNDREIPLREGITLIGRAEDGWFLLEPPFGRWVASERQNPQACRMSAGSLDEEEVLFV